MPHSSADTEGYVTGSWECPKVPWKPGKKLDVNGVRHLGARPVAESHHQVFRFESSRKSVSYHAVDTVSTHQKVNSVCPLIGQKLPAMSFASKVKGPLSKETGTRVDRPVQKQLIQVLAGIDREWLIQCDRYTSV